jgi:hypothetical protein
MKDKANNGANHNMAGKETADCAAMCAKKGAPLALLTSDGKVYTLSGGLAADMNAKLIPHISHTVEVTGDVTEKDDNVIVNNGKIETEALDPIARIAGPRYATLGEIVTLKPVFQTSKTES